MKYHYILSFCAFLVLACSAQKAPSNTEAGNALQEILEEAVANEKLGIAGISMSLTAPDLDISWAGASGFDSTEKDRELGAGQPFRIASITKSFVAAAILRLHETKKLDINHPIATYISKEHRAILESDDYEPEKISIKHCLQHRSGLFDYAMGSRDFVEAALANPQKRWTRTEQLQFAMDHGNKLGPPGGQFSYSDTGYIVLGAILESVTQKPMAEALRSLLKYEELGMNATWLESLEKRPEGLPEPVHRYFGEMDATDWDNSVDLYGGGGISSTTSDLTKFFSALFNHQIFDKEETLELMLENPTTEEGSGEERGYRMGLWQINVDGLKGYMHDGFWGTAWAHIPAYNSTLAVNYTNDSSGAGILKKTTALLKKWTSAQE